MTPPSPPDHPLGHQLFLLMVALARLRDTDRMTGLFVEALERLFPPLSFRFTRLPPDQAAMTWPVDGGDQRFGFVAANGDWPGDGDPVRALVHNAVQMLGVLMEQRRWTELLDEEKADLQKEVRDRTTALGAAGQALAQTEAQYQVLVEYASDAIIVFQDHTVCFFNRQALAVTGHTPETLMDRRLSELIHPDDRLMAEDRYRRFWAGRDEPGPLRIRVSRFDGETRWIEVRAATIDWRGRPAAMVMFSDVTDRIEAEQELKRLAAIVEYSDDAIYATTLDGVVQNWNRSAERIYGYRADEIIGRSVRVLVPPDRMEEFEGLLARAERGKSASSRQTVRRRRDGNLVHVSLSMSPIKTQSGHIVGVSAIARDITQLRQSRIELERSRQEYQDLYDHAPDMFASIDPLTGRVVKCNRTLLETLGFTADEIVDRSIIDLHHPSSRPHAQEVVGELLARGQAQDSDLQLVDRNGRPLDVMFKGGAIRDESGLMTLAQCSWRDVTSLKNALADKQTLEQKLRQAQKMEAIGTLAGGIAHDFNNILGAIMGYAQLSKMAGQQGEAHPEYIDRILEASERAKDLIRHILTFGRQAEQEAVTFEIVTVVKEALKLLRASLPSSIAIESKIDPDTGPITGDPTQVHQVLMNLCTNAAQAMRDEKGVLTIGLDRIEFRQPPEAISELAPGPYVRLTVGDTGQGIPAEIRDRIFEPYFTTKLRDEGTGLGLATVHGIVSNHGGAVTVDSRVGQGTLFYVYFPAAPATRDAGGDREIVPETGTGKILFVDDEEALADLGRAALERLGYRVHAECDSLQALETFHRAPHDFDLLITDQTMPGLTGLELSRSVLDVRPDLPIIICTGFSRSVTPEKAREIGVKGFLMKPIVLTELAKKVKQVLETD